MNCTLISFHLNCHTLGFHPQTETVNHLAQHNIFKQHHRKEQLSFFHLNGHNLGFHPKTEKLNCCAQHNKQCHRKKQLHGVFDFNGHTRISSTDLNVEPPCRPKTLKWVIPEKIHTPPTDGKSFWPPLAPGFPVPLDPSPCPDFQGQRPLLPARISLIILWPLIQHLVRWKYVESRPEYNDYIWRSILILICSCDMNGNLYECVLYW